MQITYRGGAQGLAMLTDQLRAEGVDFDYDPPVEGRGADPSVLETTITIGKNVALAATILERLWKVIKAVKKRWPRLDIELDGVSDSP